MPNTLLYCLPIPNILCDPAKGYHTPLRISELLVISHQMLFIPRIVLHLPVILDVLKHDLAETVEIGKIGHLWVDQAAHESAGLSCVVDHSPPLHAIFNHKMLRHRS